MDYVYILKCSDNTYYTGWTNDPVHRLATHNSGKGAKYTRSRLPVTIVYLEQALDKSTALKREIAIKKLKRSQKELLIKIYTMATATADTLSAITWFSGQATTAPTGRALTDTIPVFPLPATDYPIKPKKNKENC